MFVVITYIGSYLFVICSECRCALQRMRRVAVMEFDSLFVCSEFPLKCLFL